MDILSILQLLGGVGLFLYGMSLMGSSLEKLAGSGMERILEKLTTGKNKAAGYLKGWGLGAGVTAIIQSSAATTIMLIGFVNAGIMKLAQAIPVIMGANVGSTVTAQILRLGDLSSDTLLLQLLKPASFAPMLVGVGAFIFLFTKKKKAKDVAGILVGLGVLFYGMTTMENVFAPLKDSEAFQKAFVSFHNPLIGILVGLIITAIIQSSSASVGILQALSATGSVTYATAFPIIIGQNLGKCMTTILGGIGGNKKSKRLVLSYILFNLFGAVFFTVLVYAVYYTIGIKFFDNAINRGGIANIHFLFNFLTSVILLPFSQKLSKLTGIIIGDEDVSSSDKTLATLDDMLLNTPTIALEQCKNVIAAMADAIYENYRLATDQIYNYDATKHPVLEENESFIDRCESTLSAYIVKINSKRLSKDDRLVVSEILNSISDFERMGDHCMNIYYVAQDKNEKNIHFSPAGHYEVDTIIAAVDNIMKTTFQSFKDDDSSVAVRIEPMAEAIDHLKEIIKTHHVDRLQAGDCSIEGGISLVDLVTSFERISSHCANISLHIVKRVKNIHGFDEMHGHTSDNFSEEYKALYHYYESLYVAPVINEKQSLDAEIAYHKALTEQINTGSKSQDQAVTDKKTRNKASDDKHAKNKQKSKDKKEKSDTPPTKDTHQNSSPTAKNELKNIDNPSTAKNGSKKSAALSTTVKDKSKNKNSSSTVSDESNNTNASSTVRNELKNADNSMSTVQTANHDKASEHTQVSTPAKDSIKNTQSTSDTGNKTDTKNKTSEKNKASSKQNNKTSKKSGKGKKNKH